MGKTERQTDMVTFVNDVMMQGGVETLNENVEGLNGKQNALRAVGDSEKYILEWVKNVKKEIDEELSKIKSNPDHPLKPFEGAVQVQGDNCRHTHSEQGWLDGVRQAIENGWGLKDMDILGAMESALVHEQDLLEQFLINKKLKLFYKLKLLPFKKTVWNTKINSPEDVIDVLNQADAFTNDAKADPFAKEAMEPMINSVAGIINHIENCDPNMRMNLKKYNGNYNSYVNYGVEKYANEFMDRLAKGRENGKFTMSGKEFADCMKYGHHELFYGDIVDVSLSQYDKSRLNYFMA